MNEAIDRGREDRQTETEDEMSRKMKERIGSAPSEEEMEDLIASKDWPPYYMTSLECSGRKKGRDHDDCPEVRQPTNHIDPHPTICVCECHEDPELDAIRLRTAGEVPDEDVEWEEDDDALWEDEVDEDVAWDEVEWADEAGEAGLRDEDALDWDEV